METTVTLGECYGQLRHATRSSLDEAKIAMLQEGADLVCSKPIGRLPAFARRRVPPGTHGEGGALVDIMLAAVAGPARDGDGEAERRPSSDGGPDGVAARGRGGNAAPAVVDFAASSVKSLARLLGWRERPRGAREIVAPLRLAFDDRSGVVAAMTAARGREGTHSEWKYSISFYDSAASTRRWEKLQLCHEFMLDPTCVAWQPAGAHPTLAVGCRHGVCLWEVRGWGRAPSAWMSFLRAPARTAVSALAWSPCGAFLAAAELESSAVRVWDVDQQTSIPLGTLRSGIVFELAFAPSGLFLAGTTSDHRVVVWSTRTWEAHAFAVEGPAIGLAWDPEGAVLLVVSRRDPQRAFVQCIACPVGAAALSGSPTAPTLMEMAWRIDDLPRDAAGAGPSPASRAGCAWDPLGGRIAVSCGAPDSGVEGKVALYATTRGASGPALGLIDFVYGPCGASALQVAFMPSAQRGAVLAVCWSRGDEDDASSDAEGDDGDVGHEVVRFYPLLYAEATGREGPL